MGKISGFILGAVFLWITIAGDFLIGAGVTGVLILFYLYGLMSGHSIEELNGAAYRSGKKSFLVLQVFILVGAISSLWISSGTIPGIVYYGIKLIDPDYFYVLTFFITCFISFLLGSSFGTVGTVGIALIALARGVGADLGVAGGAILSGAYFGDRCSPVSSSANLVAVLTETELYRNIRNMFKSGMIPLLGSSILYFFQVEKQINISVESPLLKEIEKNFHIGWIVFIPVGLILICALLKIKVKISMGISLTSALFIGIFIQNEPLERLFISFFNGFTYEETTFLSTIIKGGGVVSMWKAALIVFVSCCLSGVIEMLGIMDRGERYLLRASSRAHIFFNTCMAGIITSSLGCNQSIAVVMTNGIVKNIYEKKRIGKEELALDIENSSILIAPLIPWNIAGLIPAQMMGLESFDYLLYSFYLYFVPAGVFFTYLLKGRVKNKKVNI